MTTYTTYWRRHTTGTDAQADSAIRTLSARGLQCRTYPAKDSNGQRIWAVDVEVPACNHQGPSPASLSNLSIELETR